MIIKGIVKERQGWELFIGIILSIVFITFSVVLFVYEDTLPAFYLSLVLFVSHVMFAEFTLSEKHIYLDVKGRRLKNYRHYLFITIAFGRWHPFPTIEKCVLTSRKEFVKTSSSGTSWHTHGYREMNYRIYLVNRSFEYSKLIHHTTNEKKAQEKLKEWATALHVSSEYVAI